MAVRVFVIDDSEVDLLFAQIVIERSVPQAEVQVFDSAREALQSLQTVPQPPALILLDINMPGMNGFEFLAAYSEWADEGRGQAPVVMLTSSPDATDRDRAFAYAAVRDYQIKPLDGSRLPALLQPRAA